MLPEIRAVGCFLSNEDGAVTVDWVVLTALVVALGIGVVATLRTGVTPVGQSVELSLQQGGGALELSFD